MRPASALARASRFSFALTWNGSFWYKGLSLSKAASLPLPLRADGAFMFTPRNRVLPCASGSLPVYGTPTLNEPGSLKLPYLSGPTGTSSSASATGMGLAVSAGGAASGAMLPRA